jgi:hypothetical protein
MAAGDLEYKKIGNRVGIITEPGQIKAIEY